MLFQVTWSPITHPIPVFYHTYSPMQDDGTYRKVDVISKEEFDIQRGTDEELVFSLDEAQGGGGDTPVRPAQAPPSAPLHTPSCMTPLTPQSSAERRPIKPEKKARFYPVPRKEGYDSQVRMFRYAWGGDKEVGA